MRSGLAVLGVALFLGHGGQPLDGGRTARDLDTIGPSQGTASDVDAVRFLAAARGAAPVICSLAAAPLGDGRGYSGPPMDADEGESGLVEWALQPSIDERDLTILEEGLRDADPCVRAMAARLLASGGTQGMRILSSALSDDRTDTRRAAVEGLGYADHASPTALIARLGDSDPGVRAAAAWALGRLEAREAAAALGDALADPVPMVQLAAIEALGEIELVESIELLLPMLRSDDARMRAAAARAIGRSH